MLGGSFEQVQLSTSGDSESIVEPAKAPGGRKRLRTCTRISILSIAFCLITGSVEGNSSEALYRLGLVTERLLEIGEEMLGDPVSGTIVLGDTVSIRIDFAIEYSYHIHIWTDSIFNVLRFWINSPDSSLENSAQGDHTALVVFPDMPGEHILYIEMIEGWDSDSAGYAAALFRYRRQTL